MEKRTKIIIAVSTMALITTTVVIYARSRAKVPIYGCGGVVASENNPGTSLSATQAGAIKRNISQANAQQAPSVVPWRAFGMSVGQG